MDWDACIVCGKSDGELICPTDETYMYDAEQTYSDFLQNVEGFQQIGKMPTTVRLCPSTSATDLVQNNAKWHRSCKIKFASTKLERKRVQSVAPTDIGRKSRRLSNEPSSANNFPQGCIICTKSEGGLRNCSTLSLDQSLRDMATELQDSDLLSRIAGGDLVAIEAKYHNNCLLSYKNKYRSMVRKQHTETIDSHESAIDSRVFVELVAYIENEVEDGEYIFKLKDLHTLYEEKLKRLGRSKKINKTRLKTQILDHFSPECQEQSDGKCVILVFNQGMQRIIRDAITSRDYKKEAMAMVSVSNTIRKEISDTDSFKFSGSFQENSEENSVPTGLKALVSMLLYGPNIKDQTSKHTRACLAICQLIVFNLKGSREKSHKAGHVRHRNYEPPLPIYIGLDIHANTRSKKLVQDMYELGLSISYKRVLEIEDLMTSALCQRYLADDLVCPTQLRKGLFTVGALDNIDHNLSSTTASGSFHGTSMSVFQFPSETNPGTCREPINITNNGCPAKHSLPESYSIVPAVACNTNMIAVAQRDTRSIQSTIETELAKEMKWVDSTLPLLSKEKLDTSDFVSWGAHHAVSQITDCIQAGTSTLLPLFKEKAASIAMVKHGMTVISKITEHCNSGQIPVMVVDQPLFALAKFIQWKWPDTLGENVFTVMLGGLHIEMSMWRVVGDLLDESGWVELLTEADVASSGTADSFLSASHLTKTRRAHQVTALALSVLQQEAYSRANDCDNNPFDKWKLEAASKSPLFHFWDLVLRLERLVLTFVRAHRERNFDLYVQTLECLAPFYFSLDHINYARWVPVHIRDMKSLPDSNNDEFLRCWVFPKTHRKFSAIPLDQAHEQNNKLVKDSGGAVGLTENPNALKRWMISGPEQIRLLKEFQSSDKALSVSDSSLDQGHSKQETFKKHVNSLCQSIRTMGNPFLDSDTTELMRIDNHDCVQESVATSLRELQATGKAQYEEYVNSVLKERTKAIQTPIKKNKLPIFKRQPCQQKAKSKLATEDLKSDYSLFSQMFIASQVRDGDLGEFFSHENHQWPPALSQHGKLRLINSKSELLDCLDTPNIQQPDTYDAKVFDGAAVVHSLPTAEVSTFGEYSQQVFLPWVTRQLQNCNRVDIVWDTYKHDSLKESTREKRGKGIRRKVSHQARLPLNFVHFLRDTKNKEELFALLSDDLSKVEYRDTKEVYITKGKNVIAVGSGTEMPSSDQEEADTRMCLHVQDAIEKGAMNIVVSTVDTDVVVIFIGLFPKLTSLNDEIQLWIEFGKGKYLRYFSINHVYQQLGDAVSRSLPFFHAFSGCDTTSQFAGKGKKTAWKTWKSIPQVTETFAALSEKPFTTMEQESEVFAQIERFTCILYDHTTQLDRVNDLRQDLFAQGKHVKLMQNLPPTQAALFQHTLRSIYQAGVWMTGLQSMQNLPLPERFGWTKDNALWQPMWTVLPEAAKTCRELIRCGCKANPQCSRKCMCKTSNLKCTYLCVCKGNCVQT